VNNLLLLPLIVPGIVLGIALYVFHVEAEIATGWPILGSIGGLVAGHVLIAIPWTVRLITASLVGIDRAVEEAAQSLGANRLITFRRITLPGILPGIVAAALFGFIASFGNLEMSLFLVGPGRTTLPIAILQYLEWKIDPTIAAVSVLQILFIGGAMLLTSRPPMMFRWMLPTASSSSCSDPPAAARPRPCASSPASSSRRPAACGWASTTSPRFRHGSVTPAWCSKAMRCFRT